MCFFYYYSIILNYSNLYHWIFQLKRVKKEDILVTKLISKVTKWQKPPQSFFTVTLWTGGRFIVQELLPQLVYRIRIFALGTRGGRKCAVRLYYAILLADKSIWNRFATYKLATLQRWAIAVIFYVQIMKNDFFCISCTSLDWGSIISTGLSQKWLIFVVKMAWNERGTAHLPTFLVCKHLNFLGVQVGALFSNFGCASG